MAFSVVRYRVTSEELGLVPVFRDVEEVGVELELAVVVVDETVWLVGEEDEEPKCFELEEPGVPVLVSLSDGGISIY